MNKKMAHRDYNPDKSTTTYNLPQAVLRPDQKADLEALANVDRSIDEVRAEYAKVFNEWIHRYAENPDDFGSVLDSDGKPIKDIGEASAAYFLELARELGAKL